MSCPADAWPPFPDRPSTLPARVFEKAYLLLGLLAGVLYALAASSLKAAGDRGMRSTQISLVANIATAIGFLVFVPWTQPPLTPHNWWPSLAAGGLFFAGQLFTMLALRRGHASIATPALGSKVVLVALLLAFGFSRPVPANVWLAAGLATVGIAVLSWPTEHLPLARVIPAVGFSVLAALCFGLFDVMNQIWSPTIGFGRLVPPAIFIAAAMSAALTVATDRRIPRIPAGAGHHLAVGIALIVSQALIIIWSIGYFHDAAGLNVVYGSRGIWSVLIVWLIGHHFTAHERIISRAMLIRRLAAAALIAAAVCLVFIR